MSARLRCITSFLSLALLAGLLPAQEKPKTVDELRKENAALRKQVKTLRAQLDAKTSKAPTKRERMKQPLHVIIHGNQLTRDRQVQAAVLQMLYRVRLADADYEKSVERLRRATLSLNSISDPTKARAIVDEIERALLDVRRVLWKLQQAEKNAKDPIKKKDKQSDSAAVFVEVPVLAVPIRLDLNWPILSEATDSNDKLFFSFRRF